MSLVTVWKSDMDNKLFEDKEKYQAHLRKLAGVKIFQRKISKMNATREFMIKRMGQAESFTDLCEFFRDNWKWFWANGASVNSSAALPTKAIPFHELVGISIYGVRWSETVRNSHSCPQGGVTNFNKNSYYGALDNPVSYPGWIGRISFDVANTTSDRIWGSSYFDDTIIHLGTGSGKSGRDGIKTYTSDVTFWAADFPVMYEKYRRWLWCEEENRKRKLAWQSLGGNEDVPDVYEVPEDWVLISPWEKYEV